jgi:hypothetical protein
MSPVVVAITGVPDVAASAAARTLTYFTVFLVMVALLHAAHYYRAERAREVREAGLARGLAEARLAALRTQLQPHFVFNVLNAVTTLLHADPMAADRMLTRFAALLRVILHEGTEEHALERELDLLARYVELMQLRFGDRIVVEWAVADAARGARVPFLVLQPLVENAYEHGLAGGRRADACGSARHERATRSNSSSRTMGRVSTWRQGRSSVGGMRERAVASACATRAIASHTSTARAPRSCWSDRPVAARARW